MRENEPKHESDVERSRNSLLAKTEEYARESYITYPYNADMEKIERQKERSAELLQELLADCAAILSESSDPDDAMRMIRETLVNYQHGNGYDLFGGSAKTKFYHDLVVALAKHSKE